MFKKTLLAMLVFAACAAAVAQDVPSSVDKKADEIRLVKYIGIDVSPYYFSAVIAGGHPQVSVAKRFDAQLMSNKQEDILAVRDAIQANPHLITPMTMMVLAIRLYDVGLRDDAVFWFYVAKIRYKAMAGVLDLKSDALADSAEIIRNFTVLAGPSINSYAFCDPSKQREASVMAIEWVEKNPYDAMFAEQFPALPGDRATNLKKAIADIKAFDRKEQQFLSDPKNLADINKSRKENHVAEGFCWTQ